ncbi:MAG: hypothetical protein ACLQIB_57215 [Isosphaeraceae bacterium]
MFAASRSPSRTVGSPHCAIPTLALLMVAAPGATPCMAQGFGHGAPSPAASIPDFNPQPSIPHFTAQPSFSRFTPPSTGYRPSFQVPHASGGGFQAAMPESIQSGINQSFRNTIAQQQMLRNQMDIQRGIRDQLNRNRMNQENERRIRDQITGLQRSLDEMNQARGREQNRRQVQAEIDRAQLELRRLQEARLAGGLNPGAGNFEVRAPQAPARARRTDGGPGSCGWSR